MYRYVLPSGDPPPPAASSLEALALPEIDDAREGTVLVEIASTEGSSLYEDNEALPTTLMAALAEVNRRFAPGRLKIRPVRVRRLEGEDSLALERGDHTALEKLHQEMHACDPQGTSPDESDPVQMTKSEADGFVPRLPSAKASSA